MKISKNIRLQLKLNFIKCDEGKPNVASLKDSTLFPPPDANIDGWYRTLDPGLMR